MRRLVSLALVAMAASCVTYTQDLDRAKTHYEANQYEAALALFRVLEHDLDSFGPQDQTKYAYLRGMTDFRLSGLATAGSNVADPKRMFRANARHWLAIAAAIEKETPGNLTEDEKKRLEETLTDLNRDVYGGADVTDAEKDKDKDKDKDSADKDKAKDKK